jgi:hypothetical protein
VVIHPAIMFQEKFGIVPITVNQGQNTPIFYFILFVSNLKIRRKQQLRSTIFLPVADTLRNIGGCEIFNMYAKGVSVSV